MFHDIDTSDVSDIQQFIGLLVVEDDVDDFYLVKELLAYDHACKYSIHHATTLDKAFKTLGDFPVDLVLLDLNLEDSDGLPTLHRFLNHHPDVPVIVLTGLNEETVGRSAIKAGAADYLPKKQASTHSLSRSVAYALERHRLLLELKKRADEDPLTKLPNRSALYKKLDTLVEQSKRNASSLAFVMVDLDDFKGVNDQLGHRVGDELLIETSRRLREDLRRSDFVARLGGDEFVMLLTNYKHRDEISAVLEKKLELITKPYIIAIENKTHRIQVSASMGVVEWHSGLTTETLLTRADEQMYESKTAGKNQITFLS